MIYGIISDIHSNTEALEAVLARLTGVEAYLCLGDIVGYGPEPSACLERLRGLPNLTCIAGNHDLAATGHYNLDWFNPYARAAVEWTGEQLSPEEHRYLTNLPLRAEVAGATLTHGSLPEPMDYITECAEARACFAEFAGPLCFVGHTHVAEVYRQREGTQACAQESLRRGGEVAIEDGLRYILNPGSIGQPRDGNPAAGCAVWDTEAGTLVVHRVQYEIPAVQGKMRKVGLPEYLAERLGRGG